MPSTETMSVLAGGVLSMMLGPALYRWWLSLVGVGLLVGLVSLLRVSPLVTATPILVLLALLAPFYLAGAGLEVWWPDAWPGSPHRLGSVTGTYLTIGALAGITVVRFHANLQPEAPGRDGSH